MEGTEFDEARFFIAVTGSGVRALLLGRRALIALGIPVLTAAYDVWIHPEDVITFNRVASEFGLVPNRTPEEARLSGRYVLENDEHVDVLLARAVSTVDGAEVRFEDLWRRRQTLPLKGGASVAVPSLDDLIATKRFAQHARDAEDIRLLNALRRKLTGGLP